MAQYYDKYRNVSNRNQGASWLRLSDLANRRRCANMPDARFRAAARDELAQLIELAAADVEEAEERLNRTLADALARLAADAAQAIFAIEANPEKQRPARPYSYGPTYQMFWASAGRFYFLEVHLES